MYVLKFVLFKTYIDFFWREIGTFDEIFHFGFVRTPTVVFVEVFQLFHFVEGELISQPVFSKMFSKQT